MGSPLPSSQIHPIKDEQENKEPSMLPNNKYEEIISTLPTANGWDVAGMFNLHYYQGFWSFPMFTEGILSAQDRFVPKPTDILLASFPKTGTTWLKALSYAIAIRTRFDHSSNPLLFKVPHDCIPFLEVDLAENSSNRDSDMPIVSTHIPYTSLPRPVIDSGCKIIYIWRDPKDTFVSMWYFLSKLHRTRDCEPISLQEAFELFCKGIVPYGPYWDHVLGYWKASLGSPGKVLFLKYEEMMEDTTFYVNKLAEFMGYPFTTEEETNGIAEKIKDMCQFKELSNLEVNKTGEHRSGTSKAISNSLYFRNGVVGGWKNDLSPEMGRLLDSIMEEKISGSGLTIHDMCSNVEQN